MPSFTSRIQVLVTDEQYGALQALARARRKPLGVLVREAVVDQLLKEAVREAKRKAAEQIAAMDLPVADWAEMEDEIVRARIEDDQYR